MEYKGFFNCNTKRVSKIFTIEKNPIPKKKQCDYIFFHTHPKLKNCKLSIPSFMDILFTLKYEYPFHYIFTYSGIYIIEKKKGEKNIETILSKYSEKKLCSKKNPIHILNSLFQHEYLSFTFISYKKIKKNDSSFKILTKLLKMEPHYEINFRIHPQ